MAERLTQWIGQQSLKCTFASIADDTGLDEKTIRNIFRDYVNVLEVKFQFETAKWMSIDEIYLISPRGVITTIENNTVLELLANRNKDTIAKYLTRLTRARKRFSTWPWIPGSRTRRRRSRGDAAGA